MNSFLLSAKPASCQVHQACSQPGLSRSQPQSVVTAYRHRMGVTVPLTPGNILPPWSGILSVLGQYLNYMTLIRVDELLNSLALCLNLSSFFMASSSY